MSKSNLKIKLLSVLLGIALIITMTPMNVFATSSGENTKTFNSNEVSIVASGDCGENGDNVKWKIESNGVLTIYGSGAMVDYSWTNFVPTTPWYEYRSSITKIVVEDGVTAIGSSAFYKLSYVTSVYISDDVFHLRIMPLLRAIKFKRLNFQAIYNTLQIIVLKIVRD